jgi:biotin operon repressor
VQRGRKAPLFSFCIAIGEMLFTLIRYSTQSSHGTQSTFKERITVASFDQGLRVFHISSAWLIVVCRGIVCSGRVLCVLAEKPGLTGSQLAEELDVSATAANRHISLLAEKGVILRSPNDDRGHVYSIRDEYREYLSRVSDVL